MHFSGPLITIISAPKVLCTLRTVWTTTDASNPPTPTIRIKCDGGKSVFDTSPTTQASPSWQTSRPGAGDASTSSSKVYLPSEQQVDDEVNAKQNVGRSLML